MICASYIFVQKIEISEGQRFCVAVCYHLEDFGPHYILTVVRNKNSLSIACVLTILTFFKNRSEKTKIYFVSGINYSRSFSK